MKVRRIMAILLFVVMLFVLVACNNIGSKTDTGKPSAGAAMSGAASAGSSTAAKSSAAVAHDTLNVVATSDYGTLAHENVTGDMFYAVQLVNEPLWGQKKMAKETDVFMILADSVEMKSPTEWIIHLKKGIKFSNGSDFKANDVLFSIKKVQASKLTGTSRGQLMNPGKSKIMDDYTIDFIWDSYHLGQWGIISDVLIYDEETYDANTVSTKPIGTGPYKVTDYVPNSYAFFERRDDYWGEKPEFKHINFRVMSESSQINNSLETGQVDFAARIANQDFDHISSLPGIKTESFYDTNFATIGFNVSAPSIMHNVDARRAVAYAIDRQAIVNLIYSGRAKVLDRFTCITCVDDEPRFYKVDDTYKRGYDIALAKQLAQSSGLAGKTVRLMTNGTTEFVSMAEMVQKMLQEIGVTVKIVNYDVATYRTLSTDDTSASAWDMNMSLNINPGYRVAPCYIMGAKTSKVLNTPGAWDDLPGYVDKTYAYFSTPDVQQRSDLTYWMIQVFEKNVLGFGICDTETTRATAKWIDTSSIMYRINGGIYYAYIKTVK